MIKEISAGLAFSVVAIVAGASQAQLFFEDFDTFSGWAGGVGTKVASKDGSTTNGWEKGIIGNLRRGSGVIGPFGLNGSQAFDPLPIEIPPTGFAFRDITGEVNPNGNYMMRALIRSEPGAVSPQSINLRVGDAATTFARFANSNEHDVSFVIQDSHFTIDFKTKKDGVQILSIPSEEGNLCSDQGISSITTAVNKLPDGATPCRIVDYDPDTMEELPDQPTVPRILFNYDPFGLWFEALLNVNQNNAMTTLWLRDVDDTTAAPLGAFERVPGIFPTGFGSTLVGLPFTAPEAAGIGIPGRAVPTGAGTSLVVGVALDNFISGHPLLATQGDFDGDGDIDGNDFLIWQNNSPTTDGTAISFSGDANGDGNVDGDDFLTWQNSFPYPAALSKTPEPASLGLLALGGLLMLRRRAI